jgi:hypothetical protein
MQREPDECGTPASISVMSSLREQEKQHWMSPTAEVTEEAPATTFKYERGAELISSSSFCQKNPRTETC